MVLEVLCFLPEHEKCSPVTAPAWLGLAKNLLWMIGWMWEEGSAVYLRFLNIIVSDFCVSGSPLKVQSLWRLLSFWCSQAFMLCARFGNWEGIRNAGAVAWLDTSFDCLWWFSCCCFCLVFLFMEEMGDVQLKLAWLWAAGCFGSDISLVIWGEGECLHSLPPRGQRAFLMVGGRKSLLTSSSDRAEICCLAYISLSPVDKYL